MKISFNIWADTELSGEEFAALAEEMLLREDVELLPKIMVLGDQHRAFWGTERGQVALVAMLNILVDTLEAGEATAAIMAIKPCPQSVAEQAYSLLLGAFFPDGQMGDVTALGDAILLCLAMLTGASGRAEAVAPFLDSVSAGRIGSNFMSSAAAIRAHFAPPPAEPLKLKAIVWDLDDTLWRGTLADGDEPVLIDQRADLVRAFNRHGVVSAICSKNDLHAARAKLEAFDLWDQFVFHRIAFVPKGAVVRQMIADMQLRPQNVLFIDDNPHNLHEVASAVPGIHLMDALSPSCDPALRKLLEDNCHVGKSRVADYRLLETKLVERTDNGLSDEAFLIQSGVQATCVDRMDNLVFAERIEELINRSNQLNYTQSRVEPEVIHDRIMDIDNYEVLSAFVWDKYGYYGLVGVAIFNFRTAVLEHFVFSCRAMHMGVEDFLIRRLKDRDHRFDAAQLQKPLPPQSSQAITSLAFADPEVRTRILAEEAPRDESKIKMRLMADCQSGAFHHYSRFADEIEFDNNPRLFSLPMMLSGAHEGQYFPPYLIYTPATDYAEWRWQEFGSSLDVEMFSSCVNRFADLILAGGHKCLLFLPPEDGPLENYELYRGCKPQQAQALHRPLNELWRAIARVHPEHFTLIELASELSQSDMVHAHHYRPAALQRIAGMIDDWYDRERAK